MNIQYLVKDFTLTKIKITEVSLTDIKDGVLEIKIPSKIEGITIDKIGEINECFVDISSSFSLFSYINIIKYSMEDGPLIINSLQSKINNIVKIDLVVPFTIQSIARKACANMTFLNIDFKNAKNLRFFKEYAFEKTIFESKCIFPSALETIDSYCFLSSVFQKGLVLNKNLETINQAAFYSACIKQKTINIPDSVKYISKIAFSDVKNVSKLFISNKSTLNMVDAGAFKKSSFKEIIIQASAADFSKANDCFSNCCNLELFDLTENKTKTIPSHFLSKNPRMKEIKFPHGIKKICSEACDSTCIENLILPSSVSVIQKSAFFHCNISKVNFEDLTLKKIGSYAFAHNKIKTLPENIFSNTVSVDSFAFFNNLFKELTLLASDTTFSHRVFSSNKDLEVVKLINTNSHEWEKIPAFMFYDCSNLKYISLPPSIKIIEEGAFENTAIDEFHSDSIEIIEKYAFSYCSHLKTINLKKANLIAVNRLAFVCSKNIESISFPPFFSEKEICISSSHMKEIQENNPFVNFIYK